MSERTDQQEMSEVENTDKQTSETSATPSKLISKERIIEYLQLSWRQVVAIWIGTIVINAGILAAVYYFYGNKMLIVSLSILAILLGFFGTITTLLPSVFHKMGKTKRVRDSREYSKKVLSAHRQLEQGETLREGSDGFEEMSGYIWENTDFTDEIKSIAPIGNDRSDTYRLKINGEPRWTSSGSIVFRMNHYEDKVDEAEEYHQEIQERRYVVLGGSIYGIAILLQAIGTIITKLPI